MQHFFSRNAYTDNIVVSMTESYDPIIIREQKTDDNRRVFRLSFIVRLYRWPATNASLAA